MLLYSPVVPLLVQRFGRITLAFGLLMVAGLAAWLAVGDGEIVTQVHFSRWVQRHYAFLRSATDLGLYPFYLFFLALFLYGQLRGERWMKLMAQAYFLAQLFGSLLTVRVLKMVLGRARPDATPLPGFESDWIGFTWDAKFHSFPSGHAADIVTSAVFMALILRPRWAAGLFVVWALAISLSRLALAKHYPSDALAGAAIAIAACFLVLRYWLLPRLERQPPFPVPSWWRTS
ncbi:MAG: phosphatase PAP2 family protein [Gammaproteobacteria bacterium]|nr:phosphatase PAP2 family protein [Gammaproteobacteria bacterium]